MSRLLRAAAAGKAGAGGGPNTQGEGVSPPDSPSRADRDSARAEFPRMHARFLWGSAAASGALAVASGSDPGSDSLAWRATFRRRERSSRTLDEISSSAKRLTIETMSVLRTDLSLRLRGVTRVFRFNINVNTSVVARGRRASPGGGGAVSSVRCETIILHTRLPFSSEDEDHPAFGVVPVPRRETTDQERVELEG